MSLHEFLGIPGRHVEAVESYKIEFPDNRVMIFGRARRLAPGELKVPFQHSFKQPRKVVVLVTSHFTAPVGSLETVTKIESDHFVIESGNSHHTNCFVSWLAFGNSEPS
jgi:hypothetical protein